MAEQAPDAAEGARGPMAEAQAGRSGANGRALHWLPRAATSLVALALVLFAALVPWVVVQAPMGDTPRPGGAVRAAITIGLFGAFILSSLVGHVLGLVAYTKPAIMEVPREKRLAVIAVVGGVFHFVACMLFNLILGPRIVALAGQLSP